METNQKIQAMNARYTIAVALCAVVVLAAFGLHALRPKPVPNRVWTRFERTGTTLDGWEWAAQPWIGNDQPYQKIRTEIDQAVASGQPPDMMIATYKAKADAAPKDPQAVFGWAYTAWRISTWSDEYQQKYNDFTDLPDALANAPFPHTYNYARLRFLIQAQVRAMPQLQELGERLVKQDAKDVDVKYQLIKVLKKISSLPEYQEALHLAQDLVKAYPKEPLYYQVLGNIYDDIYSGFSFKKSDGDKAIAAYQKQLELMRPNDDQRESVERAIKWLQSAEAQNFGVPAK